MKTWLIAIALAFVLAPTLDDLPSGFVLQEEAFTDNEEAAETDPEGRPG